MVRPFSLSCVFEVCSGLNSGLDMRGKPVRYGAKVRLKHRGTDQWLTLNPEVPAEMDSACSAMRLAHDASGGVSVLVFAPRVKTRVAGDPVRPPSPPGSGRRMHDIPRPPHCSVAARD